jgi:hypothetical protein
MTMMSPGRAISPEEGSPGCAAERADAFRGIFVVAASRVTLFVVLALAVALLEAGFLTAVVFAGTFLVLALLVLALLAVVLFAGIACLPYSRKTSSSLLLRREGGRLGPVLHAGEGRRRDNSRAESADVLDDRIASRVRPRAPT